MSLRKMLAIIVLAAAVPVMGQAQESAPAAKAEEVSIPFVQFGGIDDWRPDGREALYIKGRGDQWYHAKLMAPCQGLQFATTIGFKDDAAGSFDKFSAIVVEGQTCQLTSLVKSEKPADKKPAAKKQP